MKQFLFLFLFLISAGFMSAQRTITGTVTDEAGVSLIGANVIVKEAPTVGTITDIDGSFSLQIPSGGATLVISYAGYSTKEIPLTADASYTVTLAEGQLLEEVVVTSFGTTTRERFTGSAASISAEKIGVRPVTNVGQVLTGIAAGVQSTFGSGQPGSAPAIRIRGFGSISSSQDPLYVIDGVPTSVNIANLNADDIENVTVLKDASSTALYGSRAANGVVLITTKKGKKGKNSINVKYTRGQSGRAVARI
jgi:TonB-dependent SusC/RagA subfamily outer membrane receptor